MEVVSPVALEQGTNHCIYLYICREHIAYVSHLTVASSILIVSMLPNQVVLSLFKGSYPMLATCSHSHLSQPSPSYLLLISHIFTLSILFHVDLLGIH